MSTPALKHIFNELQYELINKLAEGGMGLVYEAAQKGSGNFRKTVAIKLIREEYSSIPEFQKNFIGEARPVTDLELYLYSDRYGPTNEKLAVYLAEVFPPLKPGSTPSFPFPSQPRVSTLESQQ